MLLIPFFKFFLIKTFHGNGKLLLSGEYFVLDGATALAIPTKQGQTLYISQNQTNQIVWRSYDEQKKCWFSATFLLPSLEILSSDDAKTAEVLQRMLSVMKAENPVFLADNQGVDCEIYLDFPRNWGLGSSSTLIYCLVQWANINPYVLLEKTMGGSGYDIACAGIHQAITYQRNGINPEIQLVDFQPTFSENLYFIHLGKKQNSREGIARYRAATGDKSSTINTINALTKAMLDAKNLSDFEKIIAQHENLIANYLGLTTAKSLYFSDFWGEIKSLGAWGGDFILATSAASTEETFTYFQEKGFSTIIPYGKMVK